MGHCRLGELPRTGYWRGVIEKLDFLSDPAKIAQITANAAHKGLELAKKDSGLANVVFLFMKSILASRTKEFSNILVLHNVTLTSSSGLVDFIGELDKACDKSLTRSEHRSHLAEMARYSVIDCLHDSFSKKEDTLFGNDLESTRQQIRAYATTKGFSILGKKFWGCFLSRFLDYHLSREIVNHIGSDKPIKTISECNSFRDAFDRHCRETIEIVKDFTGCWPSVTEFRRGLTAENVKNNFLPVALKKIKSELMKR